MIRLPFRIALFLSSYAPLFLLLAFTGCHPGWITWSLFSIAVGSLLGLALVLRHYRGSQGAELTVHDAVPDDGEVLGYVASYLVPFFGVDLGTNDGLAIFITFLAVLGIVYVNSNMILVNPILSILGFHAFKINDPDGHHYHVITRRRDIERGLKFRPAQVDRYLRIEAQIDSDDQS